MASHEGTTTDSHGGNAQQPLLSAVGVGKHFGDRLVLEGVSFAIHSGQIVTLIGPNGAAKTPKPLRMGKLTLKKLTIYYNNKLKY